MAAGAQTVFLSSNLALGGDMPFLDIAAPFAPVGAYARMKADAEQSLRNLPGAAERLAVLRLTKVLDSKLPLLEKWRIQAKSGESVIAFSDIVIAPVSLSFASMLITRIVQTKATGVFHCSGTEEISYADFARSYLRRLGLDVTLVKSVDGREINPIAAASPPHASLAYAGGGGFPHKTTIQPLTAVLDDLVGVL
jgi:dTDP-4-dehydrorhamnose reductase